MKHFLIYISLLSTLLFTSCTSNKNIIYLQDLPSQDTSYTVDASGEYQIRAGDILYVRILSLNKEITELYNITNNTNYTWNSETSLFINGFSIDKEGNIELPTLGVLQVGGMTIEQAQKVVQKKVDETLRDATVIVKLVSYKITVLGEVNNPGVKTINRNSVTILEVLGMAGDINAMGDKENVVIMRMNEEKIETHKIDLTSSDIITSPYFMLKPNDIIYVKPENARAFQANSPTLSMILSIVSSTISIITLIRLLAL